MRTEKLNTARKQILLNKFAFATRTGFYPGDPHKVNQDSIILTPNILNLDSMHFFGVCDGHGENGKKVSTMIQNKLPVILEENLMNLKLDVRTSLENSFISWHKTLTQNKRFNTYLSGSTCWTVLLYGNHLYCANWGDSRAIIVSEGDQKNSIIVKAASRDHKPNEIDEAKRIISKAGRIEPFRDTIGSPIGPQRVWLKYDDIPGLAMSRSIGDNCAK